jgi:CRP-like cAMP-binding protein
MRLNSYDFLADHELIEALGPGSKPLDCHEDCILFMQGEEPAGVYVVQSGEAALVMRSDSGGVVMCVEAGPGSILGLPGAIANQPYSMTALARSGSRTKFTTSNELRELLAANPALYPPILKLLAAEVRGARQAILDSTGSGSLISVTSIHADEDVPFSAIIPPPTMPKQAKART